jgi:hypothetical protein
MGKTAGIIAVKGRVNIRDRGGGGGRYVII